MTRTFKALSALLSYPTGELQGAVREIDAAIRTEQLLDPDRRLALEPLLNEIEHADLLDLQERYVELFDRTRRHSLHLFEHVHGEGRDRGQAMVDLAALYEKGGLMPGASELPDYLPLFLEYLSTRPLDEACALLGETSHILATLAERLEKKGTPYAAVFTAITSLAVEASVLADVPEGDAEESLAALDAAWEESAVTFGPGEALDGCSVDRLRLQMRAARRDARQASA